MLFFPGTEIDCRKGNGIGGTETLLNEKYSVQECVTAVKKQFPTANGAAMDFDCPNKCSCWAKFDMHRWEGSKYQACFFRKKGKYRSCLFVLL